MKSALNKFAPEAFLKSTKSIYDSLRRLPQLPAAYLHPLRRESRKRIQQYHNLHRGHRCFIIGNGPSLKQTDLTKLESEFTFGMNRIYLLFPELKFSSTYYVAINDLVIEQCAHEIARLPLPKFIAWHSHHHFKENSKDLIYLYTTFTGPRFSRDLTRRIWEGATVTNVALQLAFYMGFETVILIGVDHNFTDKGRANQTVVSSGDDQNHFSGNYFGKGFRWQLPDLDTSEIGYKLAGQAYHQSGRSILDATIGGRLNLFPKVEYNSLFHTN